MLELLPKGFYESIVDAGDETAIWALTQLVSLELDKKPCESIFDAVLTLCLKYPDSEHLIDLTFFLSQHKRYVKQILTPFGNRLYNSCIDNETALMTLVNVASGGQAK